MSRRVLTLLISLSLIGISGCSVFWHADPFPTGVCAPPCWLNLTPGQSTEADLNRLIAGLVPEERWDAREHYPENCKLMARSIAWSSRDFVNGFTVGEGKVVHSEIAPRFGLSLRQVVDRFGPPEYVDAVLAVGPDGSGYSIDLYYPTKGLHFESRADVQDVGWIKPNAEVTRWFFTAPGDPRTAFWPFDCGTDDDATLARRLAGLMEVLKPWPGFGQVEVRTTR